MGCIAPEEQHVYSLSFKSPYAPAERHVLCFRDIPLLTERGDLVIRGYKHSAPPEQRTCTKLEGLVQNLWHQKR